MLGKCELGADGCGSYSIFIPLSFSSPITSHTRGITSITRRRLEKKIKTKGREGERERDGDRGTEKNQKQGPFGVVSLSLSLLFSPPPLSPCSSLPFCLILILCAKKKKALLFHSPRLSFCASFGICLVFAVRSASFAFLLHRLM